MNLTFDRNNRIFAQGESWCLEACKQHLLDDQHFLDADVCVFLTRDDQTFSFTFHPTIALTAEQQLGILMEMLP